MKMKLEDKIKSLAIQLRAMCFQKQPAINGTFIYKFSTQELNGAIMRMLNVTDRNTVRGYRDYLVAVNFVSIESTGTYVDKSVIDRWFENRQTEVPSCGDVVKPSLEP